MRTLAPSSVKQSNSVMRPLVLAEARTGVVNLLSVVV